MSPSDPLQFDLYKRQLEHREALRRDIELHVEPLLHQALDADKSAIELGQSILKTGTLLNGGALVAIPAVVALFGIDAKAVTRNLLIAAGLFVIGLLLSWLSGIGGFFHYRVDQIGTTRMRKLRKPPSTEIIIPTRQKERSKPTKSSSNRE